MALSVLITIVVLALIGAVVAISAEVDIKGKVIELTLGGVVLTAITFLVGTLTSTLMRRM